MLSGKIAYPLVAALFVLSVLTYIERVPTGDDAWFAEQSYWFLKEGVIRSEFFRGLNDWDKELLVSHKFFLWFGAALMYLFGYELPVVQFTGFIPYVVLCGLLIYYLRQRGENWNSPMLLALLFLIFANRLLVKISFQNRPEMLLAALGFASYLLIFMGKEKSWKAALAGILGGLAFVGHMNGIIFLLAGLCTLVWTRQYYRGLLFALAGGAASLIYFIDVVDEPGGISTWIYQFSHDPAAGHGMKLDKKIIQLLTYPRMFLHSPEQQALTLVLLFVGWYQRSFLKKLPVELKVYTLTMFFSFWVITKGNSAMYMVLFIPFMMIVVYELYRLRPFVNTGLKTCAAAYLIIGVVGMGQLIHNNMKYGDLPENYDAIRKHLPEDGTGLVPLTFFFNEYEEFDQLLSHENYKLHYKKKNLSPHLMAAWSKKMDVDFILFDYAYLTEAFYPRPGQKIIPFYRLTFFDGRFAVYEPL